MAGSRRLNKGNKSYKKLLLAYVPCASAREAKRIGEALVRERLAACANVVPRIESVFRWRGRIARAREALLLVKTAKEKRGVVEKRVQELHSYKLPCITFFEPFFVNEDYLNWVLECVSLNKA